MFRKRNRYRLDRTRPSITHAATLIVLSLRMALAALAAVSAATSSLPAVAGISMILLASAHGAAAAESRDAGILLRDADAAFDAGDHDRALTLYQQVIAADPVSVPALRRAGLLLGWAGRAKEAVPLLEKAVRLEPGNRPTRVQLARVYSWSREWDKSLRTYDKLLAEDATDVATAVERARVLAWAGRLSESEESYRAILEKHADSSEAKLGLAQTIGWEGRLAESEAIYREELERSPAGARLGLARLDLMRGNTGAALRAARAELATDPTSEDAHEIEKAALEALRPSLAIAAEMTDDTDDNRNVGASATGSFHAGGVLDIDVTASWLRQEGRDAELQRLAAFDLDPATPGVQRPTDPDGKQTVSSESVGVALGFAAGRRVRFTLGAAGERLGRYDRPEPLDDRDSKTTVSRYAAVRVISRPVVFRLTLAHEVPKWTAFVTERNLRFVHAVAGLEGRLPWALDWGLNADAGQIRDGAADNKRFMGLGTLARRFDLGEGYSLTPRYAFRWLTYERNLDDGYFDPQRYASHVVGLDLGGRLAEGKIEWTLGASAGLERFRHDAEDEAVCDVFDDAGLAGDADACRTRVAGGNLNGARAANFLQGEDVSDTNTILGFSGRLVWNIREATSLTLYASHDESAAQTASGFTSNTFGAAARIRF